MSILGDWANNIPLREPLPSIVTDPISPHYGHAVRELDEGAWVCLTCDPEEV